MSSDVIKNPNRKKEITVKKSKHIPEWMRLGKEPIVYETNPTDAMFLGNKKGVTMKPVPKNKVEIITKDIPPQQGKVSVGQNNNWFDPEEKKAAEEILFDEVPDLPESEEDSSQQILEPGQYGVLVKDTFVLKTFILAEAEDIIEKILFDQLPQFSKVSIDDILLIRRLSLKVGVLAISE